ncbi:hypothetical protein L6452_19513 [Arctium lappa]|uniref:Uncharacterized protein n=1 Tax=Arctium lappa TaxID=4217 RepID=A0ACB9B818_ARCLA|nr:hypothetical protein L6452_19513 [Arctium lappa]
MALVCFAILDQKNIKELLVLIFWCYDGGLLFLFLDMDDWRWQQVVWEVKQRRKVGVILVVFVTLENNGWSYLELACVCFFMMDCKGYGSWNELRPDVAPNGVPKLMPVGQSNFDLQQSRFGKFVWALKNSFDINEWDWAFPIVNSKWYWAILSRGVLEFKRSSLIEEWAGNFAKEIWALNFGEQFLFFMGLYMYGNQIGEYNNSRMVGHNIFGLVDISHNKDYCVKTWYANL